ncbi:MAG: DinB family protein [Acidobacteria bacterium]|nr:DinB family protein [Acidobacteriota bacterium]
MKKVFETLAGTPGKIRREVAAMSPQEIRRRLASGKWSVQEILAHLEDIEGPGFRGRVEAIVREDHPLLPSFDQEARAIDKRYDRTNPLRTLESWARLRRANLKWLKALRSAQLKRRGTHEKMGEMSAGEFLYEWAFHDLGHLKPILEVKRYALYPRIGNMGKYYTLS